MSRISKYLIGLLLALLTASILLNVNSYRKASIVLLEPSDEVYEAKIDSLERANDTLSQIEAEIVTRWKVKNETKILYIVFADDTLQPSIRTKLLSDARIRLSD